MLKTTATRSAAHAAIYIVLITIALDSLLTTSPPSTSPLLLLPQQQPSRIPRK